MNTILGFVLIALGIVALCHVLRIGQPKSSRIEPESTDFWAWYRAYLQSPQWKEKAARCRARAGHRCQYCGRGHCRLTAHHISYERCGHELDEDLVAACDECHQVRHPNRRIA
jgi:5-methylcytosine-specific restriction endonuclease McrA